MIRIENLSKSFWVNGQRKVVFDNINLSLPTGRSLGLLGCNGAGKSTLLEVIAGTMRPDSGRVKIDGSVSWPVGLASAFHKDLTGAENVRFIARVYGVDSDALVDFVAEFSELGASFRMPVGTYSSGMRARLNFGAAMGIGFDYYLVDEVTAVGDARFRRKSSEIFAERMGSAGAIMVNHNMRQIAQHCDSALLLTEGRALFFEDVQQGIAEHQRIMS